MFLFRYFFYNSWVLVYLIINSIICLIAWMICAQVLFISLNVSLISLIFFFMLSRWVYSILLFYSEWLYSMCSFSCFSICFIYSAIFFSCCSILIFTHWDSFDVYCFSKFSIAFFIFIMMSLIFDLHLTFFLLFDFSFSFFSLSAIIFAMRCISRFSGHAEGPAGLLICCGGVLVRWFAEVNACPLCFSSFDAAGILVCTRSMVFWLLEEW